jgi:hypothetical protein
MHSSAFAEFYEQMLLLHFMLKVTGPVVATLTGVTLAAFVIYLFGVCQLCRTEGKLGRKAM